MSRYVHAEHLPYGVHLAQDETTGLVLRTLAPDELSLIGTPPATEPHPMEKPAGFRWSNGDLLVASTQLSTPLEELKNAAPGPGAMWAYDQFAAAREAFLAGQPREALTHVQRALRGDGQRAGFPEESRFHFLVGLIHLGAGPHPDRNLVDLPVALRAFATAARLLPAELTAEAGWVQLAAGWASYCHGLMEPALHQLTAAAVALPHLAEVHYLAAKVHFHRQEPELAAPSLATALDCDPDYLWEALHDGDFTPFAPLVLQAIERERSTVHARVLEALKNLAARAIALELDQTQPAGGEAVPVDPDIAAALACLEEARTRSTDDTLYGQVGAERACRQAAELLERVTTKARRARVAAEAALQHAEESLAEFLTFETPPYRFGEPTLAALIRVRESLGRARTTFATDTPAAHCETTQLAQRALASLHLSLEAYKVSAIEQVLAQRARLDAEEAAAARAAVRSGGSVKAGAWIGAFVALAPGGYASFTTLARLGPGLQAEAWLRPAMTLGFSAAAGAAIGALLGAFWSTPDPVRETSAVHSRRRQELDQTLAHLHGLRLGRHASPPPA